jgi:hypothetical protein
MNRIEAGVSGRVYFVDPTTNKGDFATIALALAQCVTDGYGTIRLMSGVYTLATKLTVTGIQIAIVANRDATIKKGNALNDNLIEVSNGFFTLSGVIIDGNKTNQAGGASDIYLSAASDVIMENCQFNSAYTHAIMWANNTTGFRTRITNCTFYNCNTAAIYGSISGAGALKGLWVENCDFNTIVNEAVYLILANTSNDIYIIDNKVDGSSQAASKIGIYVDLNTTNAARVFVMRNDVVNTTGSGIYVNGTVSKVDDNHTGGCVGSGIECYGNANSICDNTVDAITLYGIYIDDIVGGTIVANNNLFQVGRDGIIVTDTNCMDVKITGNMMKNIGTSANNTYSGVKLVGGTTIIVDGNSVSGKAANKHKYSVDEAGTGNFVMNNTSKSDVSGGATLGINLTGAGSVQGGNLRIA